jgi:hypothetical protein
LWRLACDDLVQYDDRPELEIIEARMLLLWGNRDAFFSRAARSTRRAYVQFSVAVLRQLA